MAVYLIEYKTCNEQHNGSITKTKFRQIIKKVRNESL